MSTVSTGARDALRLGLTLVPALTLFRFWLALQQAQLIDPAWLPLIRLLARPMMYDACITMGVLVVIGAWFGRIHVDDIARHLALGVPLVPWFVVMLIHDNLAYPQPVLDSVRYLGHFVLISSLPLAFVFGLLTRHHSEDPLEPGLPLRLITAGGAIFTIAGSAAALFPVWAPRAAPNIVLITVDTLRADELGVYGASLPSSPNVDALAERGVRFQRAFSAATWTLPALASLHTGVRPSQHSAVLADRQIPEGQRTLAEALRNGGYDTIAVVAPFMAGSSQGFARGFVRFDERAQVGQPTDAQLTDLALSLLGKAPPEPFFLWVHYLDPHAPYVDRDDLDWSVPDRDQLPPAVSAPWLREHGSSLTGAQTRAVQAMHAEEVHRTDTHIGRLLSGVEAKKLSRELVVTVAGGHGEMLGENGRWGHGAWTAREAVHVPLILAGSKGTLLEPRVESSTVGTSSLPRTLCGVAGLSCAFPGDDLLDLDAEQERIVFSEGNDLYDITHRTIAARTSSGWSIIRGLDDDSIRLYDTNTDPKERVDVADEHPDVVERLRRLLVPAPARLPVVQDELRPSELRGLEVLGHGN